MRAEVADHGAQRSRNEHADPIAEVRLGSLADLKPRPSQVSSTLNSRHRQNALVRLVPKSGGFQEVIRHRGCFRHSTDLDDGKHDPDLRRCQPADSPDNSNGPEAEVMNLQRAQ
jgi:hypothetical protein